MNITALNTMMESDIDALSKEFKKSLDIQFLDPAYIFEKCDEIKMLATSISNAYREKKRQIEQ